MGQFLKAGYREKITERCRTCEEADVEIVWDPPWNQSMISVGAKQQLGIE